MNTLKFLAFGNSLDSGREIIGRYQVRAEGLLPRFDPSAAAAGPGGWVRWWQRLCACFRRASIPAGHRRASAPSPEPVSAPAPAPAGGESPATASGAGVQPPSSGRMNELGPVQREFRFAHVTVVCNDLHDADFEIVTPPRARRGNPGPAAVRAVETRQEVAA